MLSFSALMFIACNDTPKQNEPLHIEQVQTLQYNVLNIYPHDETAFTEGLEFRNGYLYEEPEIQNTPEKVNLPKQN